MVAVVRLPGVAVAVLAATRSMPAARSASFTLAVRDRSSASSRFTSSRTTARRSTLATTDSQPSECGLHDRDAGRVCGGG